MYKIKTISFVIIVFFNFSLTDDIIDIPSNKKVINHDWKLNVFSLGNGMLPLGQFENNKPFKAMSLIAMKYYWLNEYNEAQSTSNISDRNRSFWWLLILNLYGIIDSYVDFHLKDFPEGENTNQDNLRK
jgi:hypothetical protein